MVISLLGAVAIATRARGDGYGCERRSRKSARRGDAPAAEDAGEAVLLVPELAQRRTVGELAMFMMKELAPHQEISVKVTGLKAGEKKLEVLWTDEEDITAISRGGLRRICTHPMTRTQLYPGLHELRQTIGARDLQGAVATLESLVPGYFASQRVWTSSASSGPVMV